MDMNQLPIRKGSSKPAKEALVPAKVSDAPMETKVQKPVPVEENRLVSKGDRLLFIVEYLNLEGFLLLRHINV